MKQSDTEKFNACELIAQKYGYKIASKSEVKIQFSTLKLTGNYFLIKDNCVITEQTTVTNLLEWLHGYEYSYLIRQEQQPVIIEHTPHELPNNWIYYKELKDNCANLQEGFVLAVLNNKILKLRTYSHITKLIGLEFIKIFYKTSARIVLDDNNIKYEDFYYALKVKNKEFYYHKDLEGDFSIKQFIIDGTVLLKEDLYSEKTIEETFKNDIKKYDLEIIKRKIIME